MSFGSQNDQYPDPDDLFSDTRMTFGEHIEDLRTHLIRAIKGFFIGFVLALIVAKWVLQFIAAPVERQLESFWNRYNQQQYQEIRAKMEKGAFANLGAIRMPVRLDLNQLRSALDLPAPKRDQPAIDLILSLEPLFEKMGIDDWIDPRKINSSHWVEINAQIADPLPFAADLVSLTDIVRPPKLSTLSIQEAFVVWFLVAMATGFVLSSPWVFIQIWSFVAAGLYPQEKKLVNVYLPFSILLFLGGVLICEFFVMDRAVEALLWFNEWLGLKPDLRLNEWLGFAIFMPLVFGLSFQTPLVMWILERIGIFNIDTYRRHRKISLFLMAVFAALITPSTDPVSMLMLWVPMSLLYELGIFLCWMSPPRNGPFDPDFPESDELVEV